MSTRRGFLGVAAAGMASCVGPLTRGDWATRAAAGPSSGSGVGALSGKTLRTPNPNVPPMPALASSGVVHDAVSIGGFGIDPSHGHPDVLSFRKKLGLLLPATNTSLEAELWRIIGGNRGALEGVGLHSTPIDTPRASLGSQADLEAYRDQFIASLGTAIERATLAQPEYLVMGMSLEHILHGIAPIRSLMTDVEARSDASWASWHDAAPAALTAFKAKRIGLLTPFDRQGNLNATRMFEDLGYEVVSSVGFACANAMHIAHVPTDAKRRAILELLVTPKNRLDAVVQCGTNMAMLDVTEELEPRIGIPILGINAVLFWYALRENGISAQLEGAGRLFREH